MKTKKISRQKETKARTTAKPSAWDRVQLARHPQRPLAEDYIARIFMDYLPIHGDRAFGDDPATIGGFAMLDSLPVVVVGQQKGHDTKENLRRNFGMPHPEGYRKALRLMKMAEKFQKSVITFIDTAGAYPGLGAEERGQAEAIARNLLEMAKLRVPVIAVIIGEGGSGGALGIGVANKVLMMENAWYSVISPEGCAAILWNNREMIKQAAEVLKPTANSLLDFKIVDEIVAEPAEGAHQDWETTARNLKESLQRHLKSLIKLPPNALEAQRYEKFRAIGAYREK